MDGSVVEIVPLASERTADEPMPSRGALWSQIRSEAAGVVQNEPLLGSLIHAGLLHHATFEAALAYRFSLKLASNEMSEQILREIADDAHRREPAVGSDLHHRVEGFVRSDAGGPHRARRGDAPDLQVGSRPDRHRPRIRVDLGDIAGLAVGGRRLDPQALALPDGETVDPVVLGEALARRRVHDRARPDADAGAEERAGIAARDEADVVGVRLVRDGQAAPGRLGPDLGLRGVTDREHRPRQLITCQHGQHIRLVLVGVDRSSQFAVGQLRVVTGGQRVEAERQRASGQRGELDPLVATHTRVGGLAAGIRLHEVVDDVLFESIGEIPDVERDVEHVGDPAGVAGVLLGAAATRSGAQRTRSRRQRQVNSDHLVTGLDRARRSLSEVTD